MPSNLKCLQMIAALVLFTVSSWPTHAELASCASLLNMKIPRTQMVLAETVSSGVFDAPDGRSYKVPDFCRVHGIAKPNPDSHINFEVWLPLKNWNGRYYQVGTGGFAGAISYARMADSLLSGNAVAGTDTGHVRLKNGGASWALGKPQKIIDYGYRSLKETTTRAKLIVNTWYGEDARYSYFAGCSNGGREALMVAQRFPEDWDGILAGAPANFLTFESVMQLENEIAQWSQPGSSIPLAKLPAIQKAAVAACRTDAHVIDGIASDPRFCRLEPESLLCKGDTDNDECLTPRQVVTLQKIYGGLIDAGTKKQLYSGYEATFEADFWPKSVIAEKPEQTPGYYFGSELLSNMVVDDPDLDIYRLAPGVAADLVNKKMIAGEPLPDILNSNNPDLQKFRDRGGKLIVYHGWGDTLPSPGGSVDYFQSVARTLGGINKTTNFYRLFMVPGMGHCGRGPGANSFGQSSSYAPSLKNDAEHNIIQALESWVENGVAPKKIVAAKYVNDKPVEGVAFTRPLCAYPNIAKYKGSGSMDLAANFVCAEGARP